MFPWRMVLQSTRSVIRTNLPIQVLPRVCFMNDVSNIDNHKKIPERNVTRDRTNPIPVNVSISYMESAAYKQTYGDDPVWKTYQRNFKGQFKPRQTRKTCMRNRMITTSSPCPVCRDEYLVVDYRNTKLLQQFISEHTGEIIGTFKTNVCQRKHKHICIAILKAKDHGLISFDVPVRNYDYSDWYKPQKEKLVN